MKAIHNETQLATLSLLVVLYPKDTEKWKQFTTAFTDFYIDRLLFCIPKILKNESNSQPNGIPCVSFRVVLYPKDTEKWKQFTTENCGWSSIDVLFCIPKILKNESNSQPTCNCKELS